MITEVTIGDLALNSDSHYHLTEMQGLDLPPVRLSSFNLAGQHFGRHVSAFYGARRFSLDGVVVGDSVSDFLTRRDVLHGAFDILNGEQTITFTLTNGRELSLTAALVGLDFAPKAGVPAAAEFHAELEAAYPFFTAASPTVLVLTLGTMGGGTVPATVPMTLSLGSGSSTTASNPGTAPSDPTIRIHGPVETPTIRNDTLGQEMSFQITMVAGEYLDVDFRNKTVTDQAGTNRYSIKDGDWWSLGAGDTVLRYVATSTDASTHADVTFYPTYLAI